jgi:uncharacterized protein (UPF0335 family)
MGTPGIGHNSGDTSVSDQLRSIVERVERLEEEKAGIADDIKDLYAEAKGNGFDVKALREIVRKRKQDRDKLKEHNELVRLYCASLGYDWLT